MIDANIRNLGRKIVRGVPTNVRSLLEARLKQGLTQEQLSSKAELDVKTVRNAEQGKRIDLETIARLADVLGIRLSDALSQVDSIAHSNLVDGHKQVNEHKQIVEKWQMAWNSCDSDGLASFYHPNATLYLPGEPHLAFSGEHCGRARIQHIHQVMWQQIPTDPSSTEYRIRVCEDLVLWQGHQGFYTSDRNLHRLSYVQIFEFEDLLISEHHVQFDTLALWRLINV